MQNRTKIKLSADVRLCPFSPTSARQTIHPRIAVTFCELPDTGYCSTLFIPNVRPDLADNRERNLYALNNKTAEAG